MNGMDEVLDSVNNKAVMRLLRRTTTTVKIKVKVAYSVETVFVSESDQLT